MKIMQKHLVHRTEYFVWKIVLTFFEKKVLVIEKNFFTFEVEGQEFVKLFVKGQTNSKADYQKLIFISH